MNEPVHIDLFSGIGGFSLAAHWAGFQTIAHCENEPFCQKVLAKNFPNVPICGDVNEFSEWFIQRFGNGNVDLVTGGFPCQDLSDAGKGAGLSGARSSLWFAMLDVVRRIRPGYVMAENVRGIFSKQGEGEESAIDTVLRGLEQAGYQVGAIVLGADDVGAPHRRKRVFVVGERNDLADLHRGREQQPEGTFPQLGRRLGDSGETVRPLADANGLRRGAEHENGCGRFAPACAPSLADVGSVPNAVRGGQSAGHEQPGHERQSASCDAGGMGDATGERECRQHEHRVRTGKEAEAQRQAYHDDVDRPSAAGVAKLGDTCRSGREGKHGRGAISEPADGYSEPEKSGMADAQQRESGERYESDVFAGRAGKAEQTGVGGIGGEYGDRQFEPGMGGTVAGLPDRMDGTANRWPAGPCEAQYDWEATRIVAPRSCPNRSQRLKALGNTVVPAQAFVPLTAIAERLRGIANL